MRQGGGSGGFRARLRRITGAARAPAFGLAVITPLVFVGAVGATPRTPAAPPTLHARAVTPLAAVAHTSEHISGPAVVAIERPPSKIHIVAAAATAPPPAAVVYTPGMLGIPGTTLAAYRNAEQKMATAAPGCGVSWNLLAGIGRIESGHANGGATDAHGTAVQPIYGPALDGSLPGNEVIVASAAPGRVVYARALGPMQFLPGTWSHYAADGNGDGKTDPQNIYDATLAAARYLCSGGLNLRDQSQVLTAILRYNNSMAYARNVMGWAAAYATGVVPVDLPPIVGAPPPIADLRLEHLEHPEGLGPGSPLNVHGLSPADPLASTSLIDLSTPGIPNPPAPSSNTWSWLPPWLQPAPQQLPAACAVICLEPQAASAPPNAGPPGPPPAEEPPAALPSYAVPPAPADGPPAPPMPAYAVPPAAPQG